MNRAFVFSFSLILLSELKIFVSSREKTDLRCTFTDDTSESVQCDCWDYIYYGEENDASDSGDYSLEVNGNATEKLKIVGCQLSDLKKIHLQDFTNLTELDVSNNRMSEFALPHIIFGHLKKLNASHNNLNEISPEFFINMRQLSVVDLSHNKIERIDRLAFESATDLEMIDLSHNQISSLEPTTFSELIKLKVLNLGFNQFKSYPAIIIRSNAIIDRMTMICNQRLCVQFYGWFRDYPDIILEGNPLEITKQSNEGNQSHISSSATETALALDPEENEHFGLTNDEIGQIGFAVLVFVIFFFIMFGLCYSLILIYRPEKHELIQKETLIPPKEIAVNSKATPNPWVFVL